MSESGSTPASAQNRAGLLHARLGPRQILQVEVEGRQAIVAGEEELRLADLLGTVSASR